jgi:hypothetical protein
MRPARSWWWFGIVVLAAVAPALSAPTVRAVMAQTGGTLVVGLDQEPPTLDPHASPSAVTYQIRPAALSIRCLWSATLQNAAERCNAYTTARQYAPKNAEREVPPRQRRPRACRTRCPSATPT